MKVVSSLFIIILCFWCDELYSQNEKIIRLYKYGEYEKCIDLINKEYKNNTSDTNILLIKAVCYSFVANDTLSDKGTYYSSLRSLRLVKNLIAKKSNQSFLLSHSSELSLILFNVYIKGKYLIDQTKYKEAIRLFDEIIFVYNDYDAHYYKSVCLVNTGNETLAADVLINLTRRITNEANKATSSYPEIPQAFGLLAELLFKNKMYDKSYATLEKAIGIYGSGDYLCSVYELFLNKQIDDLNVYSPDSLYQKINNKINQLKTSCLSEINSKKLKITFCKKQINLLIYRKNEIEMISFLEDCLKENLNDSITEFFKSRIYAYATTYFQAPDLQTKVALTSLKFWLKLTNTSFETAFLMNDDYIKNGLLVCYLKIVYPDDDEIVIVSEKVKHKMIEIQKKEPENKMVLFILTNL